MFPDGSRAPFTKELISSGDSLGASAGTQQDHYTQLISQHPSTILSLEHETLGTFSNIQIYDS